MKKQEQNWQFLSNFSVGVPWKSLPIGKVGRAGKKRSSINVSSDFLTPGDSRLGSVSEKLSSVRFEGRKGREVQLFRDSYKRLRGRYEAQNSFRVQSCCSLRDLVKISWFLSVQSRSGGKLRRSYHMKRQMFVYFQKLLRISAGSRQALEIHPSLFCRLRSLGAPPPAITLPVPCPPNSPLSLFNFEPFRMSSDSLTSP